MAVAWNDSYSFGHNKVDEERRKIFDIANQFAARRDLIAARAALAKLAEYSRILFHTEETLIFASLGQQEYNKHAHSHRVLMKHVNEITLMDLDGKPQDEKVFVQKTAAILEMWIFNHFIHEDPKVRPALLKAAQKVFDHSKAG